MKNSRSALAIVMPRTGFAYQKHQPLNLARKYFFEEIFNQDFAGKSHRRTYILEYCLFR